MTDEQQERLKTPHGIAQEIVAEMSPFLIPAEQDHHARHYAELRLSGRIEAEIDNAATAMRSACIEKVKALRGQWHDRYVAADASNREALVSKELLFAMCRAASKIIIELEAVTLDQQESK